MVENFYNKGNRQWHIYGQEPAHYILLYRCVCKKPYIRFSCPETPIPVVNLWSRGGTPEPSVDMGMLIVPLRDIGGLRPYIIGASLKRYSGNG